MFKVGNLVVNWAFLLTFVRELLYALSTPLGQNPLKDEVSALSAVLTKKSNLKAPS